jgi:hypothetical protein
LNPTEPRHEARIVWLLEFLRTDLSALGPGALLDLRNSVFPVLHEGQQATVTDFDDPDLRALKPARAVDADPVVGLARDLLARVQGALRAGVEALQQTGSWQPFGLTPDRPTPKWLLKRRDDGTVRRDYGGDWKTITVASAADLLMDWWPRLRVCRYPACGVLFLPEEGRQKYHDPKCASLARWHKWAPKRDPQKEKERRALRNGPGRGRRKR